MGKTGTTEKAGQPAWAKRILKLLEQAKAKDPDLMRFGAYSHKYKLSAPASEETIQKFEEQEGIRLPEEYRDFLLFVGNGGAGPYYGLVGFCPAARNIQKVFQMSRRFPSSKTLRLRCE